MPSSPKEQDFVHTRQYSTVESNSYLKKKTAKLSSAVLSKLFACGQRQSLTFKGWKIGNRKSRLGKRNFLLIDCLENKQPVVGSQKQVFSCPGGECNYLWSYGLRKTLVSLLLFSTAFSIQSVSAQNSHKNVANSAKKQIGQSAIAKSGPFRYNRLQQRQLGNTKKLELNLDFHQNQAEIFGSGVLTGGVKPSCGWFVTEIKNSIDISPKFLLIQERLVTTGLGRSERQKNQLTTNVSQVAVERNNPSKLSPLEEKKRYVC